MAEVNMVIFRHVYIEENEE